MSKFEIKHEKGTVTYAMRTGAVFVKSNMPLTVAKRIIKGGKDVEITDKRGYGSEISVNDKYFFPHDSKVVKEPETGEASE